MCSRAGPEGCPGNGVRGYDADKYLAMYEGAEGSSWQEKLNAMRRDIYADRAEDINAQKRAAYAARQERQKDVYRKDGDPIFDILGPASQSHPEEVQQITERARSLGVEVIERPGSIGYAPGLKKGKPGQLHVSSSDSIGAWRHEEQHMLDDMRDGWPGFYGLMDVDRRSEMEYHAYGIGIELAFEMGRKDVADELRRLCQDEIEKIGGVWDADRLPQF